ncbi:hypothetical protein V6245_01525 [Salinibacterium amurskyense]|uniref:hypothetical protein n=1 Tax=Salinibacterium amurskyense TaxID=205941 RepID=UPI00311F8187
MTMNAAVDEAPAAQPQRTRVIGTGRFTRWFILPFASVIVLTALAPGPTSAFTHPDFAGEEVIAAAFLVWALSAGLRSLFLGVWLYDDKLVARTWFRTLTIPRTQLAGCVNAPYSGFFGSSVLSWLRELEIQTVDSRVRWLSGTVALNRRSTLQTQQLRQYIQGTPHPDTLAAARAELAARASRTEVGRHA